MTESRIRVPAAPPAPAPSDRGAAPPLRIGTRASALALAQSAQVGALIAARMPGRPEVELVHVTTHGDRDRRSALAQIGGTGVFVTAVRDALLAEEVDVIVHSAKDLPTAPCPGVALACLPARADVRDALCARDGLTLGSLPEGARVGTGSPRRAAQLLRRRPDLRILGIRGNIDTRLARALGQDADLDAVVLAAAGLERLGRAAVISDTLAVDVMLPAPAQGALAVECRREELERGTPLADALTGLDDPAARASVTAERALLRALEAGCSAPVAALGALEGQGGARTGDRSAAISPAARPALSLRALAISPDGRRAFPGERTTVLDAADPAEIPRIAADLGAQLAADLLAQGAGEVLSGIGAERADISAARHGATEESP